MKEKKCLTKLKLLKTTLELPEFSPLSKQEELQVNAIPFWLIKKPDFAIKSSERL